MRRMGRGAIAAGAAVAVGIGVGVGLLVAGWPGGRGQAVPQARARVYANVDACLLTGERGVSDPGAAPVWAGLEDVSASGRARVSYVSVTGPATTADALPFLGSLLVRGCAVIVAAGGPERAAVLADARQYPAVRFVILGAAGQVPPNVDAIAFQTTGTRSAVASAVRADLG